MARTVRIGSVRIRLTDEDERRIQQAIEARSVVTTLVKRPLPIETIQGLSFHNRCVAYHGALHVNVGGRWHTVHPNAGWKATS